MYFNRIDKDNIELTKRKLNIYIENYKKAIKTAEVIKSVALKFNGKVFNARFENALKEAVNGKDFYVSVDGNGAITLYCHNRHVIERTDDHGVAFASYIKYNQICLPYVWGDYNEGHTYLCISSSVNFNRKIDAQKLISLVDARKQKLAEELATLKREINKLDKIVANYNKIREAVENHNKMASYIVMAELNARID